MESYITEEMENEFREAFNIFDKDGNGSINTEEFVSTLRSLGQTPSEQELEEMMKDFDADGNGELDFEEFKVLMRKKMRSTDGGEAIREAFQVLDTSGKGHVTPQQIYSVLTEAGERITLAEVDEMMKDIDNAKEKGRIDFDDFKEIVNSLTGR